MFAQRSVGGGENGFAITLVGKVVVGIGVDAVKTGVGRLVVQQKWFRLVKGILAGSEKNRDIDQQLYQIDNN